MWILHSWLVIVLSGRKVTAKQFHFHPFLRAYCIQCTTYDAISPLKNMPISQHPCMGQNHRSKGSQILVMCNVHHPTYISHQKKIQWIKAKKHGKSWVFSPINYRIEHQPAFQWLSPQTGQQSELAEPQGVRGPRRSRIEGPWSIAPCLGAKPMACLDPFDIGVRSSLWP